MNRVEQIMENYRKGIENIYNQYEVDELQELDTKELDEKISYEKSFLEKLETQGKEENLELIKRAKERLEIAEKEKTQKENEYEELKAKRMDEIQNVTNLKNSEVVLPSGRTVLRTEKDEMDRRDLQDKAIRELKQESKKISEELMKKNTELEKNRLDKMNFRYKFEKDENGKSTGEVINKDELDKINKEYFDIKKEMTELSEMQKQCQEYLEQFRQRDNDKMKKFSEAWNNSYKEEKEQFEHKKTSSNKTKIVLNVDNNKIYVNDDKEYFYKKEKKDGKKSKKDLDKNNIYLHDKKSMKNIDFALLSIINEIDKNLAQDYLRVIKGEKFGEKEYAESKKRLNDALDIEYKFDKDTGIFANWKEKRIARNAKKIGIASLEGISEKSVFEMLKEKASKIIDTKLLNGNKKTKALTSGEKTDAQEQKQNNIDLINRDRRSHGVRSTTKVDNKDNWIEKNALKQQEESQKKLGREVSQLMQENNENNIEDK